MTISGMLTILMYTLAPFVWLIISGLIIIFSLHLFAYINGYQIIRHRSRLSGLFAILFGLTAIAWVPWLTNSTLGYVATTFDWLALVASAIAISLIAYIIIHPLSYLISLKFEN